MSAEIVLNTISNMDFPEWGVIGTMFAILQSQFSSSCDTLIKWAVGIGGILSAVIISLWLKLTNETKEHKTEISRLNGEILNLQKEHSKELRELHIKNAIVLEKASDLLKLKTSV